MRLFGALGPGRHAFLMVLAKALESIMVSSSHMRSMELCILLDQCMAMQGFEAGKSILYESREACLSDGLGKGLGVDHGFQLTHPLHGALAHACGCLALHVGRTAGVAPHRILQHTRKPQVNSASKSHQDSTDAELSFSLSCAHHLSILLCKARARKVL